MIIKKIESAEQWYQAQQRLSNGALATGWGTTLANAIADCVRDIKKIMSLWHK